MSEEQKTIPVNSIAAADAKGTMKYHTIQRRAVGENDVHIEITYSGICHSDIHTAKGEWGPKTYPLCVGHEIIGKVAAVGSKVTKFKVGDNAGVGCFTDSCRGCEECKAGDEQYCTGGGMVGTYGDKVDESVAPGGQTHGGYSAGIVIDENYVLKVPESLMVAGGAPLLCAGITCFSPFLHHGLKAGQTLGVVGLGGLGHMAVKIAKAMGVSVTVFSRSKGKEETARAMGADNFVISTDKDQMKAAEKTLHLIYNCIAFDHDQASYLPMLKTGGTMVMVGGVPSPMNISSFAILPRRLKVAGSMIGGISETQQMLDFCGKHGITSDIELISAKPDEVEKAWARAIAGDVKYRFVIDTAATMPKLE
jgi:uncharacterized zinc-type alcohol dehydrogenase-like protein